MKIIQILPMDSKYYLVLTDTGRLFKADLDNACQWSSDDKMVADWIEFTQPE